MKKTGFDWCVDAKLRILNLSAWDTSLVFYEDSYYTELIDVQEFYRRIELCTVKANSMPRKTEMYLGYRMYGLVPYNISPIQQGIQFGHAVVDYGRTVASLPPHEKIYKKYADKDKTFIILNGGTTNTNPNSLGTLNQSLKSLQDNDILVQDFYEPDLGDQLTAIVFLVDERVYDKETYPSYVGTPYPWDLKKKPSEKELSKWQAENDKNYASWVEKIGGPKNAFLREFLQTKKLA